MKKNILIVEDDLLLAHTLKKLLKSHSFTVSLATEVEKSIDLIRLHDFQIIVLDYQLADGTGQAVLNFVTRYAPAIKVLMLTKSGSLVDRVNYFEQGVADFLSKPCDLQEFLLRLNRLVKWRVIPSEANDLVIGQVRLCPARAELIIDHQIIPLRRREFQILEYFFLNKNRVINQDELLKNIWGAYDFPVTNTIQVYISKIRSILKTNLKIKTVRGLGYLMVVT